MAALDGAAILMVQQAKRLHAARLIRQQPAIFVLVVSKTSRKLWAPFAFDLPPETLKDHNVLTIDVSNTLSNLFTSPDYLERVDSIYSPAGARYVRILETWGKETRPSGLFGPVQLLRTL